MEYTTKDINTRFDLLAQYERRCIIHLLQETEGSHAALADIVSHLMKQDPTPSDPHSIKIDLQHNHLPKLAATDILEFDSRTETVQYYGDELINELLIGTPEAYTLEA